MTSHDKDSGAKTNESFEKVAKDAGLDPDKALDYRQVDQGRNVEPLIETTIKPKAIGKGKKGKDKGKTTKGDKGEKAFTKRTIREEATCSFCSNPMTQSEKMNWHPIEGVKLPKQYRSAPGAPSGKASAVLCDDCERATPPRDYRTVVVERISDGRVLNIPVTALTR